MIQGGLGCIFSFLLANKSTQRGTFPLQEGGRSLLSLAGFSSEGVEMAVNFPCSFAALCCLALWGFTRTSDGKSGK